MAILKTRKTLIAQIVVLFVVVILIWFFINRPKDPIAGLVPEHASWYMEVDKPLEVLKGTQKGLRLFSDPNLTLFAEWQEELEFVNELLKSNSKISQFFKTATIGISAHIITGKDAGFVFYVPIPATEQKIFFDLIRNFYSRSADYKFSEREYLGQKVFEIKFKNNGNTFCLASSDGAISGSFSGFLLEEVIRKAGLLFKPNFVSRLKKDVRYVGISTNPVRMFINLKNAKEFFVQYLGQSLKGMEIIPSIGSCLAISFKAPTGMKWQSSGYMLIENPVEKGVHSSHLDVVLSRFVPDNQAVGLHYKLSDIWTNLSEIKVTAGGIDTLTKCLDNEALFALVEGEGLKKYNKLLIARVKDTILLDSWLEEQNKGISEERKYKEKVGSEWVRLCPNPNVGKKIGGKLMDDWVPLFYYRDKDFVVFSEDLSTLKRSILAFNKPVQIDKQEVKLNSNYFKFQFLVSASIPMLLESATGVFKTNFQEWLAILKSIKDISLSDNGEEESPSIDATINWKIPSELVNNWVEKSKIFIDSIITAGPYRLESNYTDKVFWVVQDIKNQSYLFDKNLNTKFRIEQGSSWVSAPQWIENVKSSASTIFLPTNGAMYLVDQNGNNISGFPLLLPDSNATLNQAKAIDYDNSLQFRFFAAGRYGSVFVSDLKGQFLEGWKPWKHDVPLSLAPEHVRIGEKDFIVMLDKMGNLILTNRKGEIQAGFPVKLANRTNQPIFIEHGLELKTSYLYILSELGEMSKYNFLGQLNSSQQLFRPDKKTSFQFVVDQKKKTFAIARISQNKVVLFDQSYRQIFEYNSKSNNILVQLFQFGASNKIFSVTDLSINQTFLFDEAGQPLFHPVLESSRQIDIVKKGKGESGYSILLAFQNRLSVLAFEKD